MQCVEVTSWPSSLILLVQGSYMPWSQQNFRLALAVKLLGIMLSNRWWPTTFHTIIGGDAGVISPTRAWHGKQFGGCQGPCGQEHLVKANNHNVVANNYGAMHGICYTWTYHICCIIFDWFMVRLDLRMDTLQDMYLNNIGICAHELSIALDSIANKIWVRTCVCVWGGVSRCSYNK